MPSPALVQGMDGEERSCLQPGWWEGPQPSCGLGLPTGGVHEGWGVPEEPGLWEDFTEEVALEGGCKEQEAGGRAHS